MPKVIGTWKKNKVTMTRVTINDTWSRHKFTADELEHLFNDEYIIITALSKDGIPYIVKGKLDIQEYHGKSYVGFSPDWGFSSRRVKLNINNTKVSLCRNFAYHTLTDSEIVILKNGGTVIYEEKRLDNKVYRVELRANLSSIGDDEDSDSILLPLIIKNTFLYNDT